MMVVFPFHISTFQYSGVMPLADNSIEKNGAQSIKIDGVSKYIRAYTHSYIHTFIYVLKHAYTRAYAYTY